MMWLLMFAKSFIVKYASGIVLEKIIVVFLKEAVKRTDSKVDDELFRIVFEKVEEKE